VKIKVTNLNVMKQQQSITLEQNYQTQIGDKVEDYELNQTSKKLAS